MYAKLLDKKEVDIKKLYKNTFNSAGVKEIPFAKIKVPITVMVDGKKQEIIPAEIASFANKAVEQERTGPLGVILNRFPKPILWTVGVETAASDGIRIAFNPVFAQELILKGKAELKDALTTKSISSDERVSMMARNLIFVIIHEAYHQIYRHKEAAERKEETRGGKNHRLANIAMDAEINRDIEKQLAAYGFAGITKKTGGVIDDRFKTEAWQDIFDAYYNGNVPPPNA